MTPQERDLLTQFLTDLVNTPAGLKDAEAASMIDNALRSRPDAAYVLVQHAIMSDQALHQAQGEIASLRSQIQGAAQPGNASFLGGGGPQDGPWGARSAAPPQQAYPQQAYAQPGYAQPAYAQQAPMPGGLFGGGGGLGSFLRNVGTTAAGVAAGDMLFSGLSGIFGGGHGFGGGGFGGGFGGGGNENIVINNYNDDGGDDLSGGDSGGDDWGGGDDGN